MKNASNHRQEHEDMIVRNRQSPAWYEGMTLDPHHFQQWDRYHRFELDMRIRSIMPLAWGFAALDIDREALANGQISLRSCRGITQDGLFFDCPGNHALPQTQGLKDHFAPTTDRLRVCLALPAEQARGRNFQLVGSPENRLTRYTVENVTLTDDNTGTTEREIGVCSPNLRIVFGNDSLDDYAVLQVAEVVRTQDGAYSLSNRFIPPCLAIGASENLMKVLRQVLEHLIAKSDALSERRRQQSAAQGELTAAEVTAMGLLHVINTFIPPLRNQYTSATCHPVEVYSDLASMAGQLLTYSAEMEMRPADLPTYDHADSGECFAVLVGVILRLLDTVLSANFVRIPLERQTDSQWVGRIQDQRLLAGAHFYLAASGEVPERKMVDELPLRMKVSGAEDIATLVNAALPGLPMTYTARPPAGLPLRPGLQYYHLEKSGRLWDSIVRSNNVAIFVPADFKGVRFELMAVTTS
jgi:type VI secretion system protein ImpJ